MKKRILAISLVVICLSLCISSTLAYFTAEERERNVITAGNIKIDLIETDGEGNPFKDVDGVMPGMAVDKVVNVKNTGANPCWVRLAVDKKIILAEGKEGTPDPSLVNIQKFHPEYWTEKDGYYYYNEILPPGELTKAPLFEEVSFDAERMGNLYQRSKAVIDVQAYAVQSANNGGTVLEAKGWPSM